MTFDRRRRGRARRAARRPGTRYAPAFARRPDPSRIESDCAPGAIELFEDQVLSRQVDRAARELKKTNRSFHTIGGAGHENNAVLGPSSDHRPGLPPLPIGRVHDGPRPPAAWEHASLDALLGIVASREDPIAQGRHKVWGSRPLWVPPRRRPSRPTCRRRWAWRSRWQGPGVGRADEIPPTRLPDLPFGDATSTTPPPSPRSTPRATARASVCPCRSCSSARTTRPGSACPPRRAGSRSTSRTSRISTTGGLVASWTRSGTPWPMPSTSCGPLGSRCSSAPRRRAPVGPCRSDAEQVYRSPEEIAAVEREDPLLRNARRLVESGAASPDQLRPSSQMSASACGLPPRRRPTGRASARRQRKSPPRSPPITPTGWRLGLRSQCSTTKHAVTVFGTLPETANQPTARTLAGHINAALTDELARRPSSSSSGRTLRARAACTT